MQEEALIEKFQQLSARGAEELQGLERLEDAIQVKNRYLGRKGVMQELMQHLRDLSPEGKKRVGQASNEAKRTVEEEYARTLKAIEARKLAERLEKERVDITLPGRAAAISQGHPLTAVEDRLTRILVSMGFEVADGPEMESDYYNFAALNFPDDHPARDMQDTFMLADGRLLRTHTSPVQVRTMQAYEPPIRIIAPGRVYRCDSDITHSPVFHQIEGLLIDEHVDFRHLKATVINFVERVFGDVLVRFRPSFFPFTEPSAEVDMGCLFCHGKGCRVCSHTGWLEIMGCGMVDPAVLAESGIDPERYSGFAFGLGIERVAMLTLEIADIRLFFENDIRFLQQF